MTSRSSKLPKGKHPKGRLSYVLEIPYRGFVISRDKHRGKVFYHVMSPHHPYGLGWFGGGRDARRKAVEAIDRAYELGRAEVLLYDHQPTKKELKEWQDAIHRGDRQQSSKMEWLNPLNYL